MQILSPQILLDIIIFLMICNESNSKLNLRSRKMAQLRASIQVNTKVGVKTSQLSKKFEIMKKQTSFLNQQDPSQCKSTLVDSSQLEELQIYNSFKEKYELLEKLGEGGNACVYKCKYKQSGKYYAVKKFRLEQENILQLKKSYVNLKELNHPSIIKYRALYFDQDQRSAFLVMEYLQYKSLNEYSWKDENDLRHIVKEIISAISYIHNQNICHRDLKPQNILYDEKNKKIKIIDFGISKKTFQRGSRRDMLTIIGTQFYLAPEVYIGGGYDERVDLWALGCTIYRLVAGYTPFQSQYHSDTITNILKGQVTYQQKIWSQYTPFLRDFVAHLLKERDQRITLSQAQKHLWLQCCPQKSRINRYVSQNTQLSEDFHNEMRHKMANASSKEEGQLQNRIKLYKSIYLIGEEYDLIDSDDESNIIQFPLDRIPRHTMSQMVPSQYSLI